MRNKINMIIEFEEKEKAHLLRISQLENIICPVDSHEWILEDSYKVNDRATSSYDEMCGVGSHLVRKFKCKKCLKIKQVEDT